MRIKINTLVFGNACDILYGHLCEYGVVEEEIIEIDEYGASLLDNYGFKYEIISGHEIKAEDIARLFYK